MNNINNNDRDNYSYYLDVLNDINELKKEYPFTTYAILPINGQPIIEINTIAVNVEIINITHATRNDFLGEYSKELIVKVPINYKIKGCNVYAAPWINPSVIPYEDQHFYRIQSEDKYLLCVGVPNSFSHMKNVILENVKTADNILCEYERFQSGKTNQIELIAYSHGKKGEIEYENNRQRYRTQ